jgi:hypothetical protein
MTDTKTPPKAPTEPEEMEVIRIPRRKGYLLAPGYTGLATAGFAVIGFAVTLFVVTVKTTNWLTRSK